MTALGLFAAMMLVLMPVQREPMDTPAVPADVSGVPAAAAEFLAGVIEPDDPPEDGLEIADQRLAWQLPDAEQAVEIHTRLEAEAGREGRKADAAVHRQVVELISPVIRDEQLRVTLRDVLRSALANSFAVRVESYNPAIEATRVVEAEAAFDATFFLNINNNKQDQPSGSTLAGTQIQTFNIEGGIRQLLPTGMQVSTSLSTRRNSNDFVFQTLNPQYFSQFVVEFRQPLLRGFGLDFNRSQIRISRNNRHISDLAFRRRVQDTLFDVESAYWRLVQARRRVPVSARLIAGFQRIYRELEERAHFDVLPIQISETKARLEAARSAHLRTLNEVYNAEDALIALMNEPRVDLADHVEIVPADPDDETAPASLPRHRLTLDRLAEVQAALDRREELREAEIRISNARILAGVAKNDALPRFDVLFRYAVDGLGKSADRSFDEVTKNDFTEYFVGVELDLPIGNRARRAAERRAKLQHSQAIAALEQAFEQVILDVNVAVRRVNTNYDVLQPNYESLEASEDRLESVIVRAERKDFVQLSQELNSHQGVANARRVLLDSLVSYSIAIIQLEKAKGTLLEYDDVSITGQTDG